MLLFARWRQTRKGRRPELPRGTGFLVLASPGRDAEWALVSAQPRTMTGCREAPPALATLVESAERYPPALAIAAAQLDRFGNPRWSPAELSSRLSLLLIQQLRRQAVSPFRLVESAREELGYRGGGEFVWALGSGRDDAGVRTVTWVSSDYQVYVNAASGFRFPGGIPRALGPWSLPKPRWR